MVQSLFWGLIVLFQIHGHRCCIEEERMGLLEIKEFVRSNKYADKYHLLPSWVDDHESECCHWERVTCNSSTGHVTHLSLHNIRNLDSFWQSSTRDNVWFLNVSLFETFKELRSLCLSYNAIAGWIENYEGMLICPPICFLLSLMTCLVANRPQCLYNYIFPQLLRQANYIDHCPFLIFFPLETVPC